MYVACNNKHNKSKVGTFVAFAPAGIIHTYIYNYNAHTNTHIQVYKNSQAHARTYKKK